MMRGLIITAAVLAAFAPIASASALMNGGFEQGPALTSWTTSGTVFQRDFELSRDFLSPVSPDWLPTEGNYFASLWSTDSAGSDVASLSQRFTASAGEIVEFDYFFDFGDVAPNYDTAIGLLTGPDGLSVVLFEHNTTGHLLGTDVDVPWTTIGYTLPSDGEYLLEFRTSDANGNFESLLGVDAVRVIPEPHALLLLALLALIRRG